MLTRRELGQLRAARGIQLQVAALVAVSLVIERTRGCQLLVFGCGLDSTYWAHLNGAGRTVFVEDQPEWADKAREQALTVRLVHYASHWRVGRANPPDRIVRPGDVPKFLDQLPEEDRRTAWDVMLIDGPVGCGGDAPGRMLPIAAARELARAHTAVFLDDCHRPIESTYAQHYWAKTVPITQRFWRLYK